MSKDPAFLFYPGDWLGGTLTFTRSHKGAYMDLLMAQYNSGHMGIDDIKTVLASDFETMWESKLKKKFTQDDNGLYFNTKLEKILNEREKYKAGRLNNFKRKKSHTDIPYGTPLCEDEDEDENIINSENKERGVGEEKIQKPKKNPEVNIPFSEFWELYAKKVGDKSRCEKKWNKLKDEDRSAIIKTLPAFLFAISDKQFQPYPETYLNQRRWENEIIIPNGSKRKTGGVTDEELARIVADNFATDR